MPIRKVKGGFKWGDRGKVFPTREGAAAQARAAYANGYVGKGLPSSLRAIPKNQVIHDPYVATRVMAHDRGKGAAKIISRNQKSAARMNERFPAPRKRDVVRNPPRSLYNTVNRFYDNQGVSYGRETAKRVQRQGQWAREMSRQQIGKSMSRSLVEIRKELTRNEKKGAATGVGVVGVGAGLAGGGIPGLKATRISQDFMRGPLKNRPGNLVRARRAGAFGYRTNAHGTLKDFNLTEEGIKRRHPGSGKGTAAVRAAEAGKVAPEEKIIRHMKLGRKASHGLLAGGAGLTAYGLIGRDKKKESVGKDDKDERRNAALVGGGTATAAGSYGAAHLLEHQGRKWTTQAKRNFGAAQRIAPELGGATVSRGKGKVPSVRAEKKVKDLTPGELRKVPRGRLERAAKLHGTATNQSYFGSVYGKMGGAMRKIAVPAGLAAAGVGAVNASSSKRKEQLGKAYTPSYFQGSVPTERLHGQRQRSVTEAQRAGLSAAGGALAAGSAGALGARWLGHKKAPHAIQAGSAYARTRGVPKETAEDVAQRAMRVHHWAKNKRGALLAGAGAASAAAGAAKIGARWKKDEVTGISQDLGRASSGDRIQRGSRKINKGVGTAVVTDYGMKAAKKWGDLSPHTREKIVQGTLYGTGGAAIGGATGAVASRSSQWHHEKKKVRRAGGIAGPVMKAETVGFGKAFNRGSNVREYEHLPENIREDVGYGSIGIRRNPMSPLDLFAASRSMVQARGGNGLFGWKTNRRTKREMNYAGARAMLYSPVGRGSVFS